MGLKGLIPRAIIPLVLITSYVNEKWDLLNRGTDSDGNPLCHVRKVTVDTTERVCVYRLVKRPKGWYNVGQFIPHFKGFRPAPERLGRKLSNSRTDLTLLSYAEHGHGVAYA